MVKSTPQPDALLGRMASLADSTRLRLLKLLDRHELGVVELCDILQLPQSTVSRHLKVLSDQGWLTSRRQATTHLYRMILDELSPESRKLWVLAREQSENWNTYHQDDLRLQRLLREKETNPDEFFAGASAEWDKLRAQLYGQSFLQTATCALIPSHYTIADLGCGTGHLLFTLAPHVHRLIGIDSSKAMLSAARKRTAHLDNVALHRSDLSSVPLKAGTCDAALLILVLTYLPDPAAVLREAARILKPQGKLIIVDLLPHDRDDFRRQLGQQHAGFNPESLRVSLTSSSFSETKVLALSPDTDTKGPALFLATANRN